MLFYNLQYREYLPTNIHYPVLVLVKDGWDDYGHKILFNLYFYSSRHESIEIGNVKILDEEVDRTVLERSFDKLTDNLCSLGQSLEYYEQIKKIFPDNFDEVLNALNDIVVLPELVKRFENSPGFHSGLLRFSAAEKAFRDGQRLLFENIKAVNENLHFQFSTKVEGADAKHEVFFDFEENDYLPFRLNVIIGKNGTGKTQYLGNMINSISGLKYAESFTPYNPLFNKIIAISYSLFDDFPKPENTTVFNYKYIGLRRKKEEIISDEKLGENLRNSLRKIIEKDRVDEWLTCIDKIIDLENIGLRTNVSLSFDWIESLTYENAKRLSSGQSSMLFILTELIAEIESESLILFDEPETHLHPTGIAQLLKSFYNILETNKSFAIISTHSPIIIQDVPSKYINIFDRNGNQPIITKLPIESFGESLSNLSKEVFQTLSTTELYKKFLKRLVYSSQKEIEELFPEGLSINALLYLESLKEKF